MESLLHKDMDFLDAGATHVREVSRGFARDAIVRGMGNAMISILYPGELWAGEGDEEEEERPEESAEPLEIQLLFSEACDKLRAALAEACERKDALVNAFCEQHRRACFGDEAAHRHVDLGQVDSSGAWPEELHKRFVLAFRQSRSQGHQHLMERLALEFQQENLSREEIQAHVAWYRGLGALCAQALALRDGVKERQEEVLSKLGEDVARTRRTLMQREIEQRELDAFQRRREDLQRRLNELRELHSEEERARAALARVEEDKQRQMDAERRQREEARRMEIRAQLQQFKEVRDALAKQRAEEEARRRAEEEQERMRRMGENAERVNYRKDELNRKRAAEEAKQRELELDAERRLEALARLAASVPYYDRILNCKANVLKTTVAVTQHADGFRPADASMPVAYRGDAAMHGFDTKRVFSDAKFRIGLALRAAGVAHTKYAGHVVRSMAAARPAPMPY